MNEFLELPFGWEKSTFGEVIFLIRGITFPSSVKLIQPTEDSIICLRTSNIQKVIEFEDVLHIPSKFIKRDEQWVQVGDTIISMANSYELVGKVARVTEIPPKTTLGGFLSIIRSKLLEPDYLFYLFRSSRMQEAIRRTASRTVNIANISLRGLEPIEILLPPLNEQRRIVAKIEALMARSQQVKEALEAIPSLLDQFRQSVLAAAFRGDLTADWRENNPDIEPASVLLERIQEERRRCWEETEQGKMKANSKTPTDDKWKSKYKEPELIDNSDLPELPDGWCWATFEQVSDRVTVGHVGSMKDEYIKDGIPFLRSQNVRENRFEPEGLQFISQKFHEQLRKSSLQPGDLVVVRSGSVGVACVIPETLKEANCSDLIIVKQPQAINPHYGAFYMNSIARSHVNAKQVGVALIHFNTKSMADMPIPVPPFAEQKEIIRHVEKLFKISERIEQNYQEARVYIDQLDQSILAKAFRGELVPQDPNDEPASVLLQRIQAERAKREAEAKAAKKSTGKSTGQRGRKVKQQDSESIQLGLPGVE